MKVKEMPLFQCPNGGFKIYEEYKKFDYWMKFLSLN